MKGYFMSFLVGILATVVMPLVVNSQDNIPMDFNRSEAKIKAFELADRFNDLSQLKDTQGQNLEGRFLDLFGLNAQLLLDFHAKNIMKHSVTALTNSDYRFALTIFYVWVRPVC